MEKPDRWTHLIEEAVLTFLADNREADLDGLLHVLQKNRIQVDEDALHRALTNLSREGRVQVDLEAANKSPVVRLKSPFVPWV